MKCRHGSRRDALLSSPFSSHCLSLYLFLFRRTRGLNRGRSADFCHVNTSQAKRPSARAHSAMRRDSEADKLSALCVNHKRLALLRNLGTLCAYARRTPKKREMLRALERSSNDNRGLTPHLDRREVCSWSVSILRVVHSRYLTIISPTQLMR